MLSRTFTGNKVAPAPVVDIEALEAQPSSGLLIVHPGELAEEEGRDKKPDAIPQDQQRLFENAPSPRLENQTVSAQPHELSRLASQPSRPTLLKAKSNLSSEEAKDPGNRLPGASRVPKARAQRFFPSATAVDKVRRHRL